MREELAQEAEKREQQAPAAGKTPEKEREEAEALPAPHTEPKTGRTSSAGVTESGRVSDMEGPVACLSGRGHIRGRQQETRRRTQSRGCHPLQAACKTPDALEGSSCSPVGGADGVLWFPGGCLRPDVTYRRGQGEGAVPPHSRLQHLVSCPLQPSASGTSPFSRRAPNPNPIPHPQLAEGSAGREDQDQEKGS